MTNEVLWECPRCGQHYPTQRDALIHLLRIHEDRTSAPTMEEEEEGETNRDYVTRCGAEAAAIAYERNLSDGFTEEQARVLAADAELQARHYARLELGLPTSAFVPTSEYVNLRAPHLGGVNRARRSAPRA